MPPALERGLFGSRLFQAYVVPVSVYLSVSIAGGYGTGREVVEFYTRHGAYEGLYGLAGAAVLMAIVSALTFELARLAGAYDYRTFFKSLIGPFWVLFEALYLCLLLLVLGVLSSAAGAMIAEHTIIPERIGLLMFLGIIAVFVFRGRTFIERIMVFLTLFLFTAFALYFVIALSEYRAEIARQLSTAAAPDRRDWMVSALKFSLYASPAAAVVLFATRGIRTRIEALVSGALCGILIMLPGLLFHISFLGGLPWVIDQPVPVHWMITRGGHDVILLVYLLAMAGTFLGTGAGFVQAVNERLDMWWLERSGQALSPHIHAGVATVGLLISALLGQLGLVNLIAKGYGTLAWGFLLVFIVPVLIVGTFRIFLNGAPNPGPLSPALDREHAGSRQ